MLRRHGIESAVECLGGNVYGLKARTRAGFEAIVTESQEDDARLDVGLYDADDTGDEPVDMKLNVYPSLVARTLKEWGA